ncbi:MAG: DUF2059 domain-containing protein, partial [Methylobacteriaceae bacterium]|nr:DUF2059 domain-containing protein [Methylobacteriaceae bacterium]
ATARKVVEITRVTDNMRRLVPALVTQLKPLVLGRKGIDKQQMEQILARMADKFETQLPKYAEIVAQVYAREFTEDELTAILELHQSPAGQLLIARQPVLEKGLMKVGREFGQRVAMEAVQEYLMEQGMGTRRKPAGKKEKARDL